MDVDLAVDEVGRKLDKLPKKEHENLRSTYERMLELGPERFQVKPSGLPVMDHLYDDLPNFYEVLDDVKRQLALCEDSRDALEITPLLLLGPPGIGKTHFARELSQLLGTGMGFISMSSMTAGWVLSGASSQWKGAHDTAGSFIDEFAEVPIDASQVIWVATANDARGIPDPILNRMNVYEVQAPDRDAARHIATKLYAAIRTAHDWGKLFDEQACADVLDRMSEMAPREMRRAWMTAFGNAKLDRRSTISTNDLPDAHQRRTTMGFVQ